MRRASTTSCREAADGRPRGPHHRDTPGATAEGLQQLDAAMVGTPGRGMGHRGRRERRNGPAHAQKNGRTKRKIAYWVMPPEADAECVAHREEVLETYAAAYDPKHPVRCMDEQP